MTKRKKRNIEKEINRRLYNNLAKEGIELKHLDPTRLNDWPLFDYQENESDYINLLPPSYRNPFSPSDSSIPSSTAATSSPNHKPPEPASDTRPRQAGPAIDAAHPEACSNDIKNAGESAPDADTHLRLLPLLIVLASLLITGLMIVS